MREALESQDCCYTLVTRSPAGSNAQVSHCHPYHDQQANIRPHASTATAATAPPTHETSDPNRTRARTRTRTRTLIRTSTDQPSP